MGRGLPPGESAAPGAGGAPRATVGSPPKKAGAAAKGCPRLTPKERTGSSTVPTEAGLDSAQKGSNLVMTYNMVARKASQVYGQFNIGE